MPDRPKRKRRWFQFSLRALLIVITVLAVWLGIRVKRSKEQARAVAAIRDKGGFVYYDYQYVEKTAAWPWWDKPKAGAEPWEPGWLLDLVGVDFFHEVRYVSLNYGYDENGKRVELDHSTDALLVHLQHLPDVNTLLLTQGQVTDRGMKYVGNVHALERLLMWDASSLTDEGVRQLSGLRNLKYLHISNSQITDDSAAFLAAHCPKLEGLSLQGNHFTNQVLEHASTLPNLTNLVVGLGDCSINDDGLVHVMTLAKLETLGIQRTRVTDAGLEHLKGMQHLKNLWLSGTAITDRGAAELQQALPNLKIER